MDKKKLLEVIVSRLQSDHASLIESAQHNLEAATHEESKPENEYDTRGLEASYLAGAQSKRVAEIEEALSIFRQIVLKNFSKEDLIASTAVVELESNKKTTYVFLMPKGGGIRIEHDNRSIQVVTGASPLGESLIGLKVGHSAIVEMSNVEREYEITNIW